MADETLSAELDLSIDAALASADSLGAALSSALDDSAAQFDAALSNALDQVAGVTATATVDADTSAAEQSLSALEAEGQATSIDVQVEADTTEAQSNIDDLGASVDASTSAISTGTAATRDYGSAAEFAGVSAGLAVGSTKELTGAATGLAGGWGAAVGVGAALGGTVKELFDLGVETTGAQQRYNATLGDTAKQMDTINVGNLNMGLRELALNLGTDDEALMNSASSLFQWAKNAGASDTQADQFGEGIIALSARAVALNPNLGSVADVADTMGIRLARGGRFAQQYGVDLNSADINTRALANTHKEAASDLSIYDKEVAAVDLATEKYGGTLAGTVKTGSENAILMYRRLQEEAKNVLEAVGQPLVSPMFDLIEASLPSLQAFAVSVGTIAGSALPAMTTAFEAVGPPLQLVSKGIEELSPALVPAASAFLAYEAALHGIPIAMTLASVAGQALVEVLPLTAAAAETASGAIITADAAVQASLGPIALIAGGLAFAASAFGLFGGGAAKGQSDLDSFTSSVVTANGALSDTAVKAAGKLFDERNQTDDLAAAGLTLTQVLTATSTAHAGARSELEQIASTTQTLTSLQQNNASATEAGRASIAATTAERNKDIAALKATSPALGDVVDKALAEDSTNSGLIGTLIDLSAAHDSAATSAHNKAAAQTDDASASSVAAQVNANLAGSLSVVQTEAQSQATTFANAQIAVTDYAIGIGTAKDAEDALKLATQELGAEIDFFLGRFVSADTATNNYRLGLITLDNQLLATGFNFDVNTQAGLNNRNALDASATSAYNASSAILAAGGSVVQATAPLADYRQHLIDVRGALAAAGQDTCFVDSLIAHTDDALAHVGGKQGDAQAAGAKLGSGFTAGVDQAGKEVSKSALATAQAGADAAAPARHEYNAAGQGFSRGMANGIGDAGGEVSAAARKVANDAVAAARAALAAKSPSQVTRNELGVPFSQGIALGITDAAPDVALAARAVLAPLTSDALDVTGSTLGSLTPGVPALAGRVELSDSSVQRLAGAMTKQDGAPTQRGLFIENATIGGPEVLADLDFFSAKVNTAITAGN